MRFALWFTAVVAIALVAAGPRAAKPRISFELVTDPDLAATNAQQWFQLFSNLGVGGLRIRGAAGKEEMGIENRGSETAPSYAVTGLLTADNVLLLPGGKFTPRDTARLKQWLENLADQGPDGVTGARSAFGLTASQLAEVNRDLKQPIAVQTKGMAAEDAIAKIGAALKFSLDCDASARRALAEVKIEDELGGLSSGTALAALLRPAGLVLTPERPTGDKFRYRLSKPVAGKESWPVGWSADDQERKLLPEMYKMISVEIDQTPVTEAVEAIADILKAPVLWDHNALALHGIDPAEIKASVPSKKLSCSQILRKVLFQARLKHELRIDEAGKPFFWITSIKSA